MPTLTTPPARAAAKEALGDPALRRAVERFVRRRVPASDVEDVVQTVFVDALAAPERPSEPAELTRWLLGIARHKVVDRHRRATREQPTEQPDLPEIPTGPAPLEARSLVQWAEEQAGDDHAAQRTLAWMAREGEGEKLDAIAEDEKLPPARVRQRVSRMRRWMKERWAAELAAVAMLAILALLAWWLLAKPSAPEAHDPPGVAPTITPEDPGSPLDRARSLRADALRACDGADWRTCLDGLDKARVLDPDGERDPAVGAARTKAEQALVPKVAPAPNDSAPSVSKTAPVPTTTSGPRSSPKSPPSYKPKASSFEDDASKEPPVKSKGSPSGTKSGDTKKRASSKVLGTGWGLD